MITSFPEKVIVASTSRKPNEIVPPELYSALPFEAVTLPLSNCTKSPGVRFAFVTLRSVSVAPVMN
jgi:hypothetical protein